MVIITIRPKYACPACQEGVHQAPAPAHLIEGGLPTEATLAHVLVGKFADHLPLYRQAQIYSRQGIELDRSTLAAPPRSPDRVPFRDGSRGLLARDGSARPPSTSSPSSIASPSISEARASSSLQGLLALSPSEIGSKAS